MRRLWALALISVGLVGVYVLRRRNEPEHGEIPETSPTHDLFRRNYSYVMECLVKTPTFLCEDSEGDYLAYKTALEKKGLALIDWRISELGEFRVLASVWKGPPDSQRVSAYVFIEKGEKRIATAALISLDEDMPWDSPKSLSNALLALRREMSS